MCLAALLFSHNSQRGQALVLCGFLGGKAVILHGGSSQAVFSSMLAELLWAVGYRQAAHSRFTTSRGAK